MDSREQIVFSTVRTAFVRAWLPTDTDIPSTKDLPWILDCRTDQDLANWKRRMEGMWFPSIPGVSAWDIAENFAEYLAFKAVETWAEKINTTNV